MQEPVLFFFKPGQFVTLELEIDDARRTEIGCL
jgi:ferredoxin-NADP reductase